MYFLDALTSSHDRSSDVEYTVASTPPLTEHSASAAKKRESVVVLPCGTHTQSCETHGKHRGRRGGIGGRITCWRFVTQHTLTVLERFSDESSSEKSRFLSRSHSSRPTISCMCAAVSRFSIFSFSGNLTALHGAFEQISSTRRKVSSRLTPVSSPADCAALVDAASTCRRLALRRSIHRE